jgi:hypothetical protein
MSRVLLVRKDKIQETVLRERPDAALAVLWQARREDLEHSRRIVIEQLRALEVEKDKLAPEDYTRDRAELIAVGAEASRELFDGTPSSPGSAAAATQIGLPAGAFPTAAGGPPTSPATSPPTTLSAVELLVFRLQVEHDVDPGVLLDIGASYGLTAYDAAYLVLADQLAAPLLTFDQRLAEAAARHFGAAS